MMRKVLILLIFIILGAGCKKDKDNSQTSDPFYAYDRNSMLENIGENIIIPSYEYFNSTTAALSKDCETFINDPNSENLLLVQNSWRAAASAWKQCELFKIGPGADLTFGLYSSVDYNPVNTSSLETAISSGTVIDTNYIQNKGASVKGLPAVEYMIFSRSGGNTYILDQFSGLEEVKIKRRSYLLALSQDLHSKASQILGKWKNSGGYLQTFIAAEGKDINSSISLLTNQLIYLTEQIKNNKVGKPLNNMEVPRTDLLEAKESGSSLNHIKDNIHSIEKAFLGKGVKGDLSGFDDLLDYIGAKHEEVLLSKKIKSQFDSIYLAIDHVEPSLQTSLEASPEKVKELYLELLELVVLFKLDMTNDLGILITISDNDGD